MRFKILLTIIFIIIFYSVNCFAGALKAKLTVRVVDTDGEPIVGVYSFANFFDGSESNAVKGETDNEGVFTAIGRTMGGGGILLKKEGYYESGIPYETRLKRGKGLFFNRWEPWDKIDTVVLKDIRNPTQMYAKNTGSIDIHILEEPIGYDLEKGDWVMPYGEGIVKDFIFIFKKSDKDAKTPNKNYQMSYKLFFSNENDGIQEYYPDKNTFSKYIWPYEAPESGYQTSIEGFIIRNTDGFKTSSDRKLNYIFRIRTELDSQSNIIRAKYGKIREGFQISLNRKLLGTIRFRYYYNPTGNRNLEYDSKNPLFKFKRHGPPEQGTDAIYP